MSVLLARAGLEYRGGFAELPGGLRVHYLDYGPESATRDGPVELTGAPDVETPAVLLVHGAGAGGAIWYRQIAALSKQFRVIAPDSPLFGLSTQTVLRGPQDTVARPCFEDFTTAYLTAFMDALGLKQVMLTGLSAGGFAGIFMALRRPERVSKLALLDAMGLGRDLPWAMRLLATPGAGYFLSRPGKRAHDLFFSTLEVAHPDGPDAEAYKRYAYEVVRNDGHARGLRLSAPALADLGGQRRVITAGELASVRAPTLIIWGEKDRFFPVSHARRAWSGIPGSTLHILPGAGHVTPWDEPERVSELLAGFFGSP